ncbi:MAG TPA: hypothetical protein VNO17_09220 [Actinomycetota bacterium]|nr:hypothetical protein [Actinomycetota bacterium]
MSDDRLIELPEGLSPEEERAILLALERYFREDVPKPDPWVLEGRLQACGQGAVQARRLMRRPWAAPARLPFARRGTPSTNGRGDAR